MLQDSMRKASTPPEFGLLPHARRLKCVRDAPSLSALEACR
jgi:hypothetical protein